MTPCLRRFLAFVLLLFWVPMLSAQEAPRWGSGVGFLDLSMPEGEAGGLAVLSVAAAYPFHRHLELRGNVYSGLNSRATDTGPRIRVEQGVNLRLVASARMDRGRFYAGLGPGWSEASALVGGERHYRSHSGLGWVAGAAWRPGRRVLIGLEYQQLMDRDRLQLEGWMLQFRYRGG